MIYLITIDIDKIKQTHDSLITNHIAMCDYFMAHESKTILLRSVLENFEMAALVWNWPTMHCKPLSIEYLMCP